MLVDLPFSIQLVGYWNGQMFERERNESMVKCSTYNKRYGIALPIG